MPDTEEQDGDDEGLPFTVMSTRVQLEALQSSSLSADEWSFYSPFHYDMVLSQSAGKFSYSELKIRQMDLKNMQGTFGLSVLSGSYTYKPKLTHKMSFQQ